MSKNEKSLASKLTVQFERTKQVFDMLGLSQSVDYTSLRNCYLTQIPKMEKDWGTRETVKYLKGTYALFTKYSCKRKCDSMELPKWSKGDRFGMPKRYAPFTEHINQGQLLTTKFILSLLRTYEVIELSPLEDTSTITDETGGAEGYQAFRTDYLMFLRTNPLCSLIKKTFNEEIALQGAEFDGEIPFHTTLKSGTEGPALANIHHQSLAINGQVKESLITISDSIYKEKLGDLLSLNQEVGRGLTGHDVFPVKTVTGKAKTALGSISFIPDKGGKTRVVAKGNYWVQNTLLPVHKALYATLRGISQDGTYRQSEIFEYLLTLSVTMEVWSSDLQTATDLWPLEMQADTMIFLNGTIGGAWFKLFRALTFDYKGKPLQYKVGGPMGIYSNWGAFTITHHFTVLYAFSITKQWQSKRQYGMIGDDNALANRLAAMKYRELLNYIKVKINMLKTWDPGGSLPGNSSIEFAKRYSLNGVEMTALPPGIINNGYQSIYNIPEVINFMVKHGYSEVLNTPLKKILDCYAVWEHNRPKMYIAFHVAGILGSPYDVSHGDNQSYNPGVEDINAGLILQYRSDRLMDNILKTADAKGAVEERTQGLLKRLDLDFPPTVAENLALVRVFKTQKLNQFKLQRKMAQAIFDKVIAETQSVPITQEQQVGFIQQVEYLTPISFKDLEMGITHREEPIHNRGKVLKELVKKVYQLRGKQPSK